MACYALLSAWKKPGGGITFKKGEAVGLKPIKLPCGQCLGCRLDYSREWAVRCTHESLLHKENSFITLTYDDEHLPEDGGLVKKHWQDFCKRLRKKKPFGISTAANMETKNSDRTTTPASSARHSMTTENISEEPKPATNNGEANFSRKPGAKDEQQSASSATKPLPTWPVTYAKSKLGPMHRRTTTTRWTQQPERCST